VRRFLGFGGAEVPEVEDPSPDALRSLAARQDLAQVRRAVADLPDRQRQALLLKAMAGMDTAEIAGAMGTGPGAVEQLLVRARASLRAKAGLDLE
jgi:RNA polymerase sigma-70 factor (ECF subfamily)